MSYAPPGSPNLVVYIRRPRLKQGGARKGIGSCRQGPTLRLCHGKLSRDTELDGEKLWRGQVFGGRMGARKERKVFF